MREAEKNRRFPPALRRVSAKARREETMKRMMGVVVLLFVACVPVVAQMGMEMFHRPALMKVFHPVVGKGAQYQSTSTSGGSSRMEELSVIGKETVDGKDAYWLQMVNVDAKGATTGGKMLLTVDDFQFHRMIIDVPGQGLMEVPANMMMTAKSRQNIQDSMNAWQSVGSDTITVPAGTFVCEHWRNEKEHGDLWTTDKIAPFGMVKEITPNSNTVTVLVKTLDNVQDRFSGPAKKFDMQQMIQQMQQQRQQNQ
jgi:hypothetical protein